MYFNDWRALTALDPTHFKAVFEAILDYAETGNEPKNLDDVGEMAFMMMRPKVDQDGANYEKRVQAAKNAAASRWRNAPGCDGMQTDVDECATMPEMPYPIPPPSPIPESSPLSSLSPSPLSGAGIERPTPEEIEREAKRAGIQVDATRFLADCERDGWRDTRGAPVRDWRKWLRGYAALNRTAILPHGGKPPDFQQRSYTGEELQALTEQDFERHAGGGGI